MAPPTEASSAAGMATMPTLRKSQKLTSSFSLRRAMSQRMVASEPVTGEIGAEVNADQYGIREQALGMRSLKRAAGDQAERQVVDKVIRDADDEAGDHGADGRSQSFRPMQRSLGVLAARRCFPRHRP